MLKKNKWYPTRIPPKRYTNLIVMTDMGYIFQAEYLDGKWSLYHETDHRMYRAEVEYPECLIKWMSV